MAWNWCLWLASLLVVVGLILASSFRSKSDGDPSKIRTVLIALVLVFVFTVLVSLTRVEVLWVQALGGVLTVASLLWLIVSYVTLGRSFSAQANLSPDHSLVTNGVFSLSRNPIYLGLLALVLAWSALTAWVFLGLAVILFLKASRQIEEEEAALESEYGPKFIAYRSRVPRWII